ncbi:hypothetical protein Golax_004271, partial [Gossypium laxum]|nr:hypothetical protein [Gossypium laxum]
MTTPVCPFVKAARPDDNGSAKKSTVGGSEATRKDSGDTATDCPLCGADIEKLEADTNLQSMVDRFIEGHARIKRAHVGVNGEGEQVSNDDKKVIYEDVSLDRGAFLVQQAMRAFRAQNIESAKSRLIMCAEDIRDQLEKMGNTSE